MAYDFEEADGDRIDNITSHADYTTTVSCSFWVKAESNPGSHQAIFVSKGKDGANEPNCRFLWTPAGGGDVYTVAYAGGGFHEWKADYSPTTGSWEHWYFEIDWTTNPDTHRFWVNGVEKTMTHNFGTNNITPSTTATQTITLGGSDTGDANNADALISDVAFWSDIVGVTRAQGLYNSGNGGLAAALYPTNLVEDIPLRVDPDNRKGGAGSLVNTPVLSTDNPFTATILRASASNSASTGTAVSVSAPTGTTTGDTVVVTLHGNGQTTFVDNNGATPFTASSVSDYKPNTSGGHTVSIYYRTIQAGDPATYNFTMGATGRWSIIADTYKSPNTTSFFDVAPSTSNAANVDDSAATTINAPTITTLTGKAIHVVHGYFDDGSAGNPSGPSGYYAAGADNDEPQVAVLKHITTASATGAQTVTGTSVAPRIALSYAIRDINSSLAASTYVNSFYGPGGYF